VNAGEFMPFETVLIAAVDNGILIPLDQFWFVLKVVVTNVVEPVCTTTCNPTDVVPAVNPDPVNVRNGMFK
jgi:hypothetical protein